VLSVTSNGQSSLRLPSAAALASRNWRDISDEARLDLGDGSVALLNLYKHMQEIFEEGQNRRFMSHVLTLAVDGSRNNFDVIVTLAHLGKPPKGHHVGCASWSENGEW